MKNIKDQFEKAIFAYDMVEYNSANREGIKRVLGIAKKHGFNIDTQTINLCVWYGGKVACTISVHGGMFTIMSSAEYYDGEADWREEEKIQEGLGNYRVSY